MTCRIVLASTNRGKLKEFARLFDDSRIDLVSLADCVEPGFEVEETGSTFEDNAWLKALAVCKRTGLPALSDDSGIEVDALGGRPGVYSARYAGVGAGDQANNELLLRELDAVAPEERTARFVCCLAFAAPQGSAAQKIAVARGTIEGRILRAPRGTGGFGYDPLFEPIEFLGRTTAELNGHEKDQISHRGQAARTMLGLIADWLDAQTSP